MSYVYATAEDDRYRLRIMADEDPLNPRTDFDHLATMVCWHPRYYLGDEQIERDADVINERLAELVKDSAIIMALYLMDHSGISMSTDSGAFEMADGQGWDWGQVGFIYVTLETMRKELPDLDDAELTVKAKEMMVAEVKEYDKYLRGDVWGFILESKTLCNHGDIHYDFIDSTFGFYEDDVKKAIKYYLLADAEYLVDMLNV